MDAEVIIIRLLKAVRLSGIALSPKPLMFYFIYKNNVREQVRGELIRDYVFVKGKTYSIGDFEYQNAETGKTQKLILNEVNAFFVEIGEDKKERFIQAEFEFDQYSIDEIKKINESKKRDRIFERIWIGGDNKFKPPSDMVNIISTAITVVLVIMLIYVLFVNFPQVINPIYDIATKTAPKDIVNATAKVPIIVGGG